MNGVFHDDKVEEFCPPQLERLCASCFARSLFHSLLNTHIFSACYHSPKCQFLPSTAVLVSRVNRPLTEKLRAK